MLQSPHLSSLQALEVRSRDWFRYRVVVSAAKEVQVLFRIQESRWVCSGFAIGQRPGEVLGVAEEVALLSPWRWEQASALSNVMKDPRSLEPQSRQLSSRLALAQEDPHNHLATALERGDCSRVMHCFH